MSRREKEKKASLDALSKFAYAAGGGAPAPKPAAPPKATPMPKPAPRPPPPAPVSASTRAAEVARAKQMAQRREKILEQQTLKKRRENELVKNANLAWRGSGFTDIPASIRRTGFDIVEPSVSQKIQDVLGDARKKESREKAKDKGKRTGGRA